MPTRIHDSDTESSGLSNDLHEERVPTTLPKQMLVSVETPSRYDSDNDNNNGDETYYNIDTISKLNPKILRGMLIELTKRGYFLDAAAPPPELCVNPLDTALLPPVS
ncbi:uncharacterized protein UBRO2_00504 [Ustilago bromivora]|uniref:Uncharacterized protein n=1 Tax=Ustilago bromivora TaxID=307758 RepID=A0A8H8QJA0_9BASI|nr:uncharacterized protein UBRO2_00504 [Ustilago bromivora]